MLRSTEARELSLLRASALKPPPSNSKANQMAERNLPPPPQLIYRTATSLCLRPRPFTPLKGPRIARYAMYGKPAGAGVDVSLNNVELEGTGEKRAPDAGSDQYDPFPGCFTITGLPRGQVRAPSTRIAHISSSGSKPPSCPYPSHP